MTEVTHFRVSLKISFQSCYMNPVIIWIWTETFCLKLLFILFLEIYILVSWRVPNLKQIQWNWFFYSIFFSDFYFKILKYFTLLCFLIVSSWICYELFKEYISPLLFFYVNIYCWPGNPWRYNCPDIIRTLKLNTLIGEGGLD